jgi:hypothetical protein
MSNLRKHTLHLGHDQYARLSELHPEVSAAKLIRQILESYLKAQEQKLIERRQLSINVEV